MSFSWKEKPNTLSWQTLFLSIPFFVSLFPSIYLCPSICLCLCLCLPFSLIVLISLYLIDLSLLDTHTDWREELKRKEKQTRKREWDSWRAVYSVQKEWWESDQKIELKTERRCRKKESELRNHISQRISLPGLHRVNCQKSQHMLSSSLPSYQREWKQGPLFLCVCVKPIQTCVSE